MKTFYKISKSRKLFAFLELHELDHLKWEFGVGWSADSPCTLTIHREQLGETEADKKEVDRLLKRLFPAEKFKTNYDGDGKDRTGTHRLDKSFSITCTVKQAMTCSKKTPQEIREMTQVEKDEYFEAAARGEVDITVCEPTVDVEESY